MTSLVAGVAVALVGVLLLLHEQDSLDLTFAVFVPLGCAMAGAILLTAGLSRRD